MTKGYFYVFNSSFHIGANCPNCGEEFSLLKGKFVLIPYPNEDERSEVLVCLKCFEKSDIPKITEDVKSGKIKLTPMRQEPVDNVNG